MTLVQLQQQANGTRTLVLNDPDRRNAMSLEMADQFRAVIDRLREDPDKRLLVLTGAGRAFSAGGDLVMLREKAKRSESRNRADMLAFYDAFLCMLSLPIPIIAAVNGHAIGAGACLAMACDYRVVVTPAKIGFTFTRLGLHPGMGATCLLPRIAGFAGAQDLLLSGRVVSATEAEELGLVNQRVTPDALTATVEAYGAELRAAGPLATAGLLATLRPQPTALQQALDREASQQAKDYASPDFQEGIAAALAGRRAEFGP